MLNIPVNETSPWIRWDLSIWDDLIAGQSEQRVPKKSFLFRQEEAAHNVYIIKSGRFRITCYRPDGGEKQLYIAESGTMCGEFSCVQSIPHSSSAVAIVDSVVYCLPYGLVEERMQRDWQFSKTILEVICRKSIIYQEQVLELSFDDAAQRISRLLLNIASQYGRPHPDGTYITIKFTHEDVGSMVNVSRVTTSNLFASLSEKGVIKRESGHYIICNSEKLDEIVKYGIRVLS